MAEWEEAERAIIGRHIIVAIQGLELIHEILMGEHHALGFARGSRCVNDGGEIRSLGIVGANVALVLGIDFHSGLDELGHEHVALFTQIRSAFQGHEYFGFSAGLANRRKFFHFGTGTREGNAHIGVLDDVLSLLRSARCKNGNRDTANTLDAKIRQDPVGTIGGEDRNLVAHLHAQVYQFACYRADGLIQFAIADLMPASHDLVAQGDGLAEFTGTFTNAESDIFHGSSELGKKQTFRNLAMMA